MTDHALPEAVTAFLDGRALHHAEEAAIVVCTVDADGFAHPALSSRGEILAIDPRTIRMAIATTTRTAGHARRDGRLTLILVLAGVAYYIKGIARELSATMRISAAISKWQIEITSVRADHPDPTFDAGADLVGGITFINPPARQARARLVLAELRE
jgi:hypothetical protein